MEVDAIAERGAVDGSDWRWYSFIFFGIDWRFCRCSFDG